MLVAQESAYAFRHALLAEAAYDDLLPGERVRLHARYAEALRKGQASGTAAELARHARLALDYDTALDASIRAGREAMSVGGPDDAARHFEQALQLLADPQRRPGNITGTSIRRTSMSTSWSSTPPKRLMAGGHPLRADALLADRLTTAAGRHLAAGARAPARRPGRRHDHDRTGGGSARGLRRSGAAAAPGGLRLRAGVLASHARILSAFGRYEEAQTVGLEALALAERLDLRVLASDVITTLSGLKKAGPPDALRTALREAVRAGRGERCAPGRAARPVPARPLLRRPRRVGRGRTVVPQRPRARDRGSSAVGAVGVRCALGAGVAHAPPRPLGRDAPAHRSGRTESTAGRAATPGSDAAPGGVRARDRTRSSCRPCGAPGRSTASSASTPAG